MILQTKVANRREWALKSWDRKCKHCAGQGYLGNIEGTLDLIVWCKCARLQKFDMNALQAAQETEDTSVVEKNSD